MVNVVELLIRHIGRRPEPWRDIVNDALRKCLRRALERERLLASLVELQAGQDDAVPVP